MAKNDDDNRGSKRVGAVTSETTGKQQHVDLHRKLDLRRRLLDRAEPGPVYVPFVGDGDCALACYPGRDLWCADLDPLRVANSSANLVEDGRDVTVVEADCDGWPFPDYTGAPFAAGDFDAYAYPYESFRAWWRSAPKRDRVVVWFTDGQLQTIKRNARYRHPDGTFVKLGEGLDTAQRRAEMRAVYNGYWSRIVKPWIEEFAALEGWRIVDLAYYTRGGHMLYWGAILDRGQTASVTPRGARATEKDDPGPRAASKVRRGKWDPDEVIRVLAEGLSVVEAAAHVGTTDRTIRRRTKTDAEFAERYEAALAEGASKRDPHGTFDEARRAEFLELLRQGKRRRTACRLMGMSPNTMYAAIARDETFADEVRAAEDESDEEVENALREAAVSGNVIAAQVWLYNRQPGRWRDKRNTGLPPGGTGPGPETKARPDVVGEDIVAALLAHPEGADLIDRIAEVLGDGATPSETMTA